MRTMRSSVSILLLAFLFVCGQTAHASPPTLSFIAGNSHSSSTAANSPADGPGSHETRTVNFPLTASEVDKLCVLPGSARIVIAGVYMPSDLKQYFVASGTDNSVNYASVLFFKGDRYDHKVDLWKSMADVPSLTDEGVAEFDNKYINLGPREGPFHVDDFARNGLDQIFLLYEAGMGSVFVVVGYDGSGLGKLFSTRIDNTYAYPIQTPTPGVFKIFPQHGTVEQINRTTYKMRYLIYTWNSKDRMYRQTGEGTQLEWWDEKSTKRPYPLSYPIDEKPSSAQ